MGSRGGCRGVMRMRRCFQRYCTSKDASGREDRETEDFSRCGARWIETKIPFREISISGLEGQHSAFCILGSAFLNLNSRIMSTTTSPPASLALERAIWAGGNYAGEPGWCGWSRPGSWPVSAPKLGMQAGRALARILVALPPRRRPASLSAQQNRQAATSTNPFNPLM